MKDRIMYIHAAYDCIQSIEEYIHGYQLEQFLHDKKTQDAVIRNLEVLGQNIKEFGVEDLKMEYQHIPWSQIVGMRNIFAHDYFGVDNLIIWETVNNHLQPIKKNLEKILQLHRYK